MNHILKLTKRTVLRPDPTSVTPLPQFIIGLQPYFIVDAYDNKDLTSMIRLRLKALLKTYHLSHVFLSTESFAVL